MPTENKNEDSKEETTVQTSLFDSLSTNFKQENTKKLSDIQKKYIFASLKAINKINELLLKEIEKLNMHELYFNIEMPLIETLAHIEHNGMYINREKLLEFGNMLLKEILELENKIYELAGEEFNINSPSQLGTILFEKLNLPVSKKTKKGYATDKETLDLLVDKHEIVQYILDYKSMAKLKSTYVDGLIDCISKDKRIHTTFMQTVTATGRLSSVDPNLQNIPVRTELGSRIRDCFEAQGDNIIIDADYSQI